MSVMVSNRSIFFVIFVVSYDGGGTTVLPFVAHHGACSMTEVHSCLLGV